DLVRVADGRLAGLPQVDGLLGDLVGQRDRVVRQRVEARQRVRVERRELATANPVEELLRLGRVRRRGVHAEGDVGVVADIALVSGRWDGRAEESNVHLL